MCGVLRVCGGNRMKKARYQVINGFQTLDDDGDWSNDYQEGDIMWRIIGTNKFEDEDGNLVIFSQKDIKDYLMKVGQKMKFITDFCLYFAVYTTFWVVSTVFMSNASIQSLGAARGLAIITALISNHYDGKHDD